MLLSLAFSPVVFVFLAILAMTAALALEFPASRVSIALVAKKQRSFVLTFAACSQVLAFLAILAFIAILAALALIAFMEDRLLPLIAFLAFFLGFLAGGFCFAFFYLGWFWVLIGLWWDGSRAFCPSLNYSAKELSGLRVLAFVF